MVSLSKEAELPLARFILWGLARKYKHGYDGDDEEAFRFLWRLAYKHVGRKRYPPLCPESMAEVIAKLGDQSFACLQEHIEYMDLFDGGFWPLFVFESYKGHR